MDEPSPGLIWLRDRRLASLAVSPLPGWLWSLDVSRLLWANPTGAAIFGAATSAALGTLNFDAGEPPAAEIARLADTLPQGGVPRLERLRGFGAGIGHALTCACSRIALADNSAAILVVATESAGPALALHERLQRLVEGTATAIAFFAADGSLLHASPAALAKLGGATSLSALRTEVAVDRIGADGATVQVTTFADASPLTEAMPVSGPAADDTPPQSKPATKIRHPLRFVWQIDDEGRFTIGAGEFIELIGPRTAAALGQPWPEIVATLGLDPDGQIARAIATHDTWSGLCLGWPVDGREGRLTVELSGLPVFDRDRVFRGYRGFGVCRDLVGLNALVQMRRNAAIAPAVTLPAPANPVAPAPEVERAGEDLSLPPVPETDAESIPVNDKRPVLTLLSQIENVVPFRSPTGEPFTPTLSPVEHHAFRELSRRLNEHLNDLNAGGHEQGSEPAAAASAHEQTDSIAGPSASAMPRPSANRAGAREGAADTPLNEPGHAVRALLERFPVGVLVYRLNHLIYANRAFLQWTGYDQLAALVDAGGLDSLLVEPGAIAIEEGGRKSFAITSVRDPEVPAEGRLFLVPWDGESAFALVTVPAADERQQSANATLARARAEIAELNSILDTATDGVIVLDREASILSSNRSAQALFGYDSQELTGRSFIELLAPESVAAAIGDLDSLRAGNLASFLHGGREVIGRERQGGLIPLFMAMGRIGEGTDKFCAVFRDITPWKRVEEELLEAKQQAEKASSAKSDFLAKVSHEIRTPLNAIIGFSEVMMEERFGPVGNERYRQYLRDIHTSGGHLMSLINDLLDLSKIEAGKVDLDFADVALNELTRQCVALMQPQANRERIIIRTSLSPKLPRIIADARSVRQIVLNLLSNSIKFTGAGGQVIVSSARTDQGEVALRVRDTGIGMSEKDIAAALEPFRQIASSTRWGSGGTGLGLPLTKALAEANRAQFSIKSTPNAGTLAEVIFPAARVLTG